MFLDVLGGNVSRCFGGHSWIFLGNTSGFLAIFLDFFRDVLAGGNASGFLGRLYFGGFEQFWESFCGILEVCFWAWWNFSGSCGIFLDFGECWVVGVLGILRMFKWDLELDF